MLLGASHPCNRKPKVRTNSAPLRASIILGIWTFTAAVVITLPSQRAMLGLSFFVALPILLLIILLGVLFDIIGVAVTVADAASMHALAAKKIPGSRQALALLKNRNSVSSFCNDFVGDIAGTVSGAAATALVFQVARINPTINDVILGTVIVGLAAGLTVGGKAAGKSIAINRANEIVRKVGEILYYIEETTGLTVLQTGGRPRRGR